MAQPKRIVPELKNNAEPMNGVRRLRTAAENGHDPPVDLRNEGASVHDRRIGRRKPVAAAVMAYLPMARAREAASFLARQVTRQFVLASPPPIKPQDRLLAELAPADGATGTCIEKMRSAGRGKYPRRMTMRVPIRPICSSIFVTFGRKTRSIAADIFGPRRAGQPGCRKTTNFTGREVTTNRGRIKTKVIPVFVGIGLVLSACSANTDYGPPSYAYFNPIRGSSNPDFGYWDGWRGQSVSDFSDGQFGGHVPPPY
jgi:hypothetical protein